MGEKDEEIRKAKQETINKQYDYESEMNKFKEEKEIEILSLTNKLQQAINTKEFCVKKLNEMGVTISL